MSGESFIGKMQIFIAFCGALLAFWDGCEAIDIDILVPEPKGSDVGLIILPGAELEATQYNVTALAVQQVSPQSVWVSLTGGFLLGVINPIQIVQAVRDSITQLHEAGMPQSAPVYIAGHSLAGVVMQSAIDQLQDLAEGYLMWGSYVTRGNLAEFPIPVMTVAGDIDGQTRVTRIAKTYSELLELTEQDPNVIYTHPIAVLPEVNHAIFASGPMPPRVEEEDIPTDLEDAVGKAMIAEATAMFLLYLSEEDGEARQYLEEQFDFATEALMPILDLLALEVTDNFSPWSVAGQETVSTLVPPDIDRVQIINTETDTDNLTSSRPYVDVEGDSIVIYSYSHVQMPEDPLDLASIQQTAEMIWAKMKSMEGIRHTTEDAGLDFTYGDPITCKDINMQAWDEAVSVSSQAALDRFDASLVTPDFEEDYQAIIGPEWILSNLRLQFDNSTRTWSIRSPSLKSSPIIDPEFGGQQYCKLLSPARALEFIYIDALKLTKDLDS